MNIIRITDRMKAAIPTLTGKEISHFEITDFLGQLSSIGRRPGSLSG